MPTFLLSFAFSLIYFREYKNKRHYVLIEKPCKSEDSSGKIKPNHFSCNLPVKVVTIYSYLMHLTYTASFWVCQTTLPRSEKVIYCNGMLLYCIKCEGRGNEGKGRGGGFIYAIRFMLFSCSLTYAALALITFVPHH